jgi:hypothetical protein
VDERVRVLPIDPARLLRAHRTTDQGDTVNLLAWFDPEQAERIRVADVARYAEHDTPKVIRRRQHEAADAYMTPYWMNEGDKP